MARIIVDICHNSSVSGVFPRCGTQAVAFLPQLLGAPADPWAGSAKTVESVSRSRHKRERAVKVVVIMNLSESR
jgi:hypothetical protein